MSSRRSRRARSAPPENEERWLLTYADMITLLMALFMVLFSISSVNISKYQTLQQSLKAAFSGSILSGGRAIMQSGSESTSAHTPATAEVPSIVPLTPSIPKPSQTTAQVTQQISKALQTVNAANQEQASFLKLQRELNAYARSHGFSNQVQAVIDERGLVVRVLTDKLLFDSGSAELQTAGLPLLQEIAHLLDVDHKHPITVEGNTDNQPIHSAQFPSNWELSTDRATTVLRYLIANGVAEQRLSATGYAALHPLASNATAAGRASNRRVDIVLNRIYPDTNP
ncbi:MAG TPA: flagellar motor protein MotB [Solirubrobacteraceae bacterium]|jgi:chemotaxis protein MotB|nr:flagellar motor protein MotB [Solirubrobacteraceae bacterium]